MPNYLDPVLDPGLAAVLAGVRNWSEATRHGLAGPFLETLVAQHLLAFAESSERPTALYHYRTHAGAEVDFVLARASRLIPMEVKSANTIKERDTRGMKSFLKDMGKHAAFGLILYAGATVFPVARNMIALPLMSIFEGLD